MGGAVSGFARRLHMGDALRRGSRDGAELAECAGIFVLLSVIPRPWLAFRYVVPALQNPFFFLEPSCQV
jgi:hypothetical protein